MNKLTNVGKGLIYLALTICFAVGVPMLLLAVLGQPFPTEVSGTAIREFLRGTRVDESFVIRTLVIVAWIAWFNLALCLAVEFLALVRGKAAPHVPFSGPMQPIARKLVAGIALIFVVGVPSVAGASPLAVGGLAAPQGTAVAAPELGVLGVNDIPTMRASGPVVDAPTMRTAETSYSNNLAGVPTMREAAGSEAVNTAAAAAPTPAPAGSKIYEVQRRDTLWDIAETHLGDPLRWREIFTLNEGVEQAAGGTLTDPNMIRPGWQLVMPGDAVGIAVSSDVAVAGVTVSNPAPVVETPAPETPAPVVETPAPETPAPVVETPAPETPAPAVETPTPESTTTLPAPPVADMTPRATTPAPPVSDMTSDSTDESGTAATPRTTTPAPPVVESQPDTSAADDVGAPTAETTTPAVRPRSLPAPPIPDLAPAAASGTQIAASYNDTAIASGVTLERGGAQVEASAAVDAPVMRPAARSSVVKPAGLQLSEAATVDGHQLSRPDGGLRADGPLAAEAAEAVFFSETGDVLATDSGYNVLRISTRVSDPLAEVEPAFPQVEATGSDEGSSLLDPDVVLPIGIVSASLLATGIGFSLTRRRRGVARRSEAGMQAEAIPPELVPVEAAVRMASDAPGLAWLNLALRSLAGELEAQPGRAQSRPQAVQLTSTDLEVLLSSGGNTTAPEPWRVTGGGWAWTISSAVPVGDLAQQSVGARAPLPALVTLGRTESGPVWLDLEALGATCIAGDSARAANFARSVVLELGNSPLADHVDVMVVGMNLPGAETLSRVRHVASINEIVAELERRAHTVSNALDAARLDSTFAARLGRRSGDPLAPVVVVVPAEQLQGDLTARLVTLSGLGGRGIALLVVGDSPGMPWRIEINGDQLEVPSLGLRVLAQGVDEGTAGQLAALLAHASKPAAAVVGAPATPAPVSASARYLDPPFEVDVCVMGPVEVLRGRAPLDRRQTELVTFLALHLEGVTDDQVKNALWPDRLPALSTFNNLVSTARTQLGSATSGELHLPTARDGRYRVGSFVRTDLQRLRDRVAYARHQTGPDQITTLKEALRMVRGQAFAGATRGYEWAITSGLSASIEREVVDAAHWLATLCLAANDVGGAQEAVHAGLLISPLNEVLIRDRMLAYDLAGNPQGVESTMRDLVQGIDVEGPISDDDVHPETYALYERLTRRRRTATA